MGGPAEKLGSPRKRPRKCVGCGTESAKQTLIRIVRTPGGEIVIDAKGRLSGRGAYVCANITCVRAAKKKNAIARTLKTSVEPTIYEELETLCRVCDYEDR